MRRAALILLQCRLCNRTNKHALLWQNLSRPPKRSTKRCARRASGSCGRGGYGDKELAVSAQVALASRQDHRLGPFRAWGCREANLGKPVNLGLFTVDGKAPRRWVLTVNHPDVPSPIAAVF